MIYRIDAACGSNIGCVRANNEDNFYFDGVILPQQNYGQIIPLHISGERGNEECMAVFDGMGGGDYGEAASYAAAAQLRQLVQIPRENENVEQYLEEITLKMNAAVWNTETELGSYRMGTTAAMLYFNDDRVYACNIGDSRIFGLRGDNMMQISQDHTDEAYMKERGITGRRPRLTQHLGMDAGLVRIEPYIAKARIQSGDKYLICSDGLTDMLEKDRMKEILTFSGTASACVENLITEALENGGKDNVTVIVCRILDQIESWSEENGTDKYKNPMAELENHKPTRKRQLWNSLRDTATNAWRRHGKGRHEGDYSPNRTE